MTENNNEVYHLTDAEINAYVAAHPLNTTSMEAVLKEDQNAMALMIISVSSCLNDRLEVMTYVGRIVAVS